MYVARWDLVTGRNCCIPTQAEQKGLTSAETGVHRTTGDRCEVSKGSRFLVPLR